MIHRILLCGLLALATSACALADTVKDREGAVRQDRAARENDPRWIYSDVDRGFAEARRTGKPLLVVPSCVHCHQVNDGLRVTLRNQQQTLPETLIYPNPAPETVGLVLADDHVARVMSVAPGSTAARAGFLPGDDIERFAGQPLISPADFSWALHRQPNPATVQAVIRRGSNTRTLDVQLPEGWRRATDISHRAGTWGMRAMASGGLQLQDLTDAERRERCITADSMALRVRHAGEYGHHAAAKKAGFRKDDVLVALEGRTNRITESQWIGSALTRFKPGGSVPATVLRGTNRVDLVLPIQ